MALKPVSQLQAGDQVATTTVRTVAAAWTTKAGVRRVAYDDDSIEDFDPAANVTVEVLDGPVV